MTGTSAPTTCRSCKRVIVFIPSASSGAPIPCEVNPTTVVLADGRVVSGRVSHFATCPNAAHHRKRAAPPDQPPDREALRALMAAGFEVVTPAGLPLRSVAYATLSSATRERDRVTRTNRLENLRIRWKGGEIVTRAEARLVLELEREDQGEQQDLPAADPRPNSPEDVGF